MTLNARNDVRCSVKEVLYTSVTISDKNVGI